MADIEFEPIIGRYLSVEAEGATYRDVRRTRKTARRLG